MCWRATPLSSGVAGTCLCVRGSSCLWSKRRDLALFKRVSLSLRKRGVVRGDGAPSCASPAFRPVRGGRLSPRGPNRPPRPHPSPARGQVEVSTPRPTQWRLARAGRGGTPGAGGTLASPGRLAAGGGPRSRDGAGRRGAPEGPRVPEIGGALWGLRRGSV